MATTALRRARTGTRTILAAARDLDCDLIVTGAGGIGGFRGLVLGSVPRTINKGAPFSTLVVAATGATPSHRGRR